MATLAELEARLETLLQARATGARRVEIGDRRIEFRTDSELAAAIADLERRIAGLPVNLVYVNSTKGLAS